MVNGCHEFYFSQKYWECLIIPNWRSHIFQRGGPTTNQLLMSNHRSFPQSLLSTSKSQLTLIFSEHRVTTSPRTSWGVFVRDALLVCSNFGTSENSVVLIAGFIRTDPAWSIWVMGSSDLMLSSSQGDWSRLGTVGNLGNYSWIVMVNASQSLQTAMTMVSIIYSGW